MTRRVLLAVDDSPAALAAARLAVELAGTCGAALRAVTVVADHAVTERLGADRELHRRRQRAADTVLRHADRLAGRAGVPVETTTLAGDPAPCILDEARDWRADLIVLGRANPSGPGQPYIGGETRHVLEFADVPVLVVPAAARPPEADPDEADPAEADPAEADPAEADPAEADPAEADPAEADPAEADPAQP